MKQPVRDRVVLANVYDGPAAQAESELAELAELAESAGGAVVGSMSQKVAEGRTSLGEGKLVELAALCRSLSAHVVVTRKTLSPGALKRLEEVLPCRVIDRTGLILDIFAQRARSREGQLQVELAQLMYRLPRLTGKGLELSRLGARGGGLGTRGPGEQKLEYDRRRIRARVSRLKKEIEKLRERRGHQRRRRHERSLPSVVLAGYTNAGKSTLFNALSRARATAEGRMFSTLDPQVRSVRLPGGGGFLLSDTVGFIKDLPDDLRVAFRATLEEIADADAILHVADSSHPESASRIASVENELGLLGAGSIPTITVLNKADLGPVGEAGAPAGADQGPAVFTGDSTADTVAKISAKTGYGMENLKTLIERILRAGFWRKLAWRNPSPRLMAELASMGVAMSASVEGNGALEAWLSPAQAAMARKIQPTDQVLSRGNKAQAS